jgi:hypothetical protein
MTRFDFSQPAFRASVLSFLGSRFVVLTAAWLGLSNLPRLYHGGPITEFALGWDGAWYAGIAKVGYFVPPAPSVSNLAFPPVLPLLAHLLGELFGALGVTIDDPDYGSYALAGLIVSNVAFLVALYLLWHLVAASHPQAVANRTLWLIAAFPAGIFWSAFYTESLFLLLVVGCLLAARRGIWPLAGALGALAQLTRWIGVVLVVVLIIEWVAARAKNANGQDTGITLSDHETPGWGDLGWVALIPLSLALCTLYAWSVSGNFWIILQARAGMGQTFSLFPLTYARGVSLLWQSLAQSGPDRDLVLTIGYGNSIYMWLDLCLPVIFAILGVIGWRQGWLLPGDLAWLIAGIIFPLSTGTTFSMTRYLMPVWPAAVVLVRLGTRWPLIPRVWLAASTVLLAVCAYLFANEKWIG